MPEGNSSNGRTKGFFVDLEGPMSLHEKTFAAVFTFHELSEMVSRCVACRFDTVQIRGHLAPCILSVTISARKRFKG
jgi:hypothetical protein